MSTNLRDTLYFTLGTAALVFVVMTQGETSVVSSALQWLSSLFSVGA